MTDLDTLNSFDQLPLYLRAMKAAAVMADINAHLGQAHNTLWHPESLQHWGVVQREKERKAQAREAAEARLIASLEEAENRREGLLKGLSPREILDWALDHQSDLAKLAEKSES